MPRKTDYSLTTEELQLIRDTYAKHKDPKVRTRAQIIYLLHLPLCRAIRIALFMLTSQRLQLSNFKSKGAAHWLGTKNLKFLLNSMTITNKSLYDPNFVRRLFDEMSQTYGLVNLVASFGFAWLWRKQCVRAIDIEPNATVLDLMTGMGELCPDLLRRMGKGGRLLALDISTPMCQQASQHTINSGETDFVVVEANALQCPLEDESVDNVFSTFGLKTFNDQQLAQLAVQVNRVLRPGGQFAFLEISVPKSPILRWPYYFYINFVVPQVGKLMLGNPNNYRLLGVYTEAFANCDRTVEHFNAVNLETNPTTTYFFGCATGFTGRKPTMPEAIGNA